MAPHDCPRCGRYYRPQHESEAQVCKQCTGTARQVWDALRRRRAGQPSGLLEVPAPQTPQATSSVPWDEMSAHQREAYLDLLIN
jgi:hypothetical protein